MNSKIIIILAIVLIVISGYGILEKRKEDSQKNHQYQSAITAKVFVLTKDIKKGEPITSADFVVEEKKLNLKEMQDSYILNKPIVYIKDCIATTSLKSKTILKYEFISRDMALDDVRMLDLSNPQDLPFDFVLPSREFRTIKYIKKGELVDIYFRYELKSKGAENTIIAKAKEGSSSKENANLANLVLLFGDKRVLDIRKDLPSKSSQESPINDGGTLVLQMSSEEIRSIYAIENLGKFYVFPAKPKKHFSSGTSTQEVLSQDFIKELRGGDRR